MALPLVDDVEEESKIHHGRLVNCSRTGLRRQPPSWKSISIYGAGLITLLGLIETRTLVQTSSYSSSFPRYVRYLIDDETNHEFKRIDLNAELYPSKRTIDISLDEQRRQQLLENSKEYNRRLRAPLETEDCKAQYEWQKQSYPTCNKLFEIDLTDLLGDTSSYARIRHIANGYWRDVFVVQDSTRLRFVVKTLRMEHEYLERNYERHRRDAMSMERLTLSPMVMDIYGFCGNSGIFELAGGGDVSAWWSASGGGSAASGLYV